MIEFFYDGGSSNDALAATFSAKVTPDAATGGTVTSVDVSGGTTGLTATGGPITTGGVITLGGTLAVANGGTGVTSSTGSGSVVLSTSPTLVTPALGTPSSVTLTNASGLPLTTGVTGTLPVLNGGTGVTTSTGSGSNVLSASPALTGTPTAPTATAGTNSTQIATTAYADAVGALQVNKSGDTMTGKLTTVASATTGAGLTLPHGAAPTTPVNGDVWTTTGGLFARVNGATQGPYSTTTGTVTSVSGTGTVNGITLTGSVTASGSLTLGGTLSGVSLTTQVTGTLPIANGGTNATATPTNGGVSYGTGTAYAFTAAGTSGQFLLSNGAAAPTWKTLDLTDMPSAAFKQNVVAATTANITLSGTQTIDGIAVTAGQRVLVKNQTTASANGIYLASATAWSRSADADTADEIAGGTINVDQGTANGGTLWTNSFKPTDTLGTTAMNWYRVFDTSQTLAVANGGTGVTTSTGTGSVVLSTSPALTTPNLGTPSSATLTNATGLPLTTGVTGTLPVLNGGTGVTTATGTGSVVLSASPALTGTPTAPTATAGTNSTQIATTAYADAVGALKVSKSGDTMTGKLTTVASSTTAAGLTLPHGAAPTTPVNGDLWTTTAGLFARINGATVAYSAGGSGTVTSVSGTGSVNGITLTGTVTSSGSLTLGGTLSGVSLTTQVSGTLPIANGGTNGTATPTNGGVPYGTGTAYAFTAAGTSGQALVSAGAAAPAWTTLGLDNLPDAWVKKAVKAATTANITLSGAQTIDGVSVVAGDRVLVKNQTTASANGIYTASATAWSRSADADTTSEIAGGTVSVDQGTANGGKIFTNSFKTTDTLGTTAMSWSEVSSATPSQLALSGTIAAEAQASGVFAFNSGYGSVAPAYGCRAWVNFNGTGTVAIRASGNVTSITDNGVGDYTINFTTAMSDANYALIGIGDDTGTTETVAQATTHTTTTCRIRTLRGGVSFGDPAYVQVAAFR